jgi:hypothetical protein
MKSGNPIDAYVFPNTDHGILEFIENADGSRRYTRISEGYLRLVTDWINDKRRDLTAVPGRSTRAFLLT